MSYSSEEYIRLFSFALNDELEPADAALFIQGDGLSRPEIATDLYHKNLIKKLVVTGEVKRNPKANESRIKSALRGIKDIPKEDIILESNSINTREQADEFMKLAKTNNWKSVILAVALYHKPRAYATFIRAMNKHELKIKFINHPVRALPWFSDTPNGTRYHLLNKEIKKINTYAEKGHVAGFKEVLAYQKWKEKK